MNTTPQTTTTCSCCGTPLTDPESVKLGIGPICREKQQEFLGAIGTSVEEIGALALLDNPTATRWITLFARAARKRDRKYSEFYLRVAREAAATPALREDDIAA